MAERDTLARPGEDGAGAPPRANGELLFDEPWQSRVFGIAVALREAGVLDWESFRARLIAEIGAFERNARADEPWSYYTCWRRALEGALAQLGLCSIGELDARERRFAARPHGHDHDRGREPAR